MACAALWQAASAALDDLAACQSGVDGECSVEQAVLEESEGRLVVELIRQLEMIRLHALDLENKNHHFLQAINRCAQPRPTQTSLGTSSEQALCCQLCEDAHRS
jgi:hypothetical protein